MGNSHAKPHPRIRNKKQVHWKAADRPSPPGRPHLASDSDFTPDLVTIRWSKPPRDGGSPITGYLVEHRRFGSPHWVRATPLLVPFAELTISGLEPGWRYQFRVSAENAVGLSDPSDISEPLTVTLQKFAITAPQFTEELTDRVAMENEKAEFTVHFLGQPPPKVSWYKDGFEVFSSRRTRIHTEPDRSVLTIHQCALSDEGEIKCTATNRAGHVSTRAKLALEAPPSIRLPRQYEDGLLFEIGEVMRLKVSIAGRPTPLVFWTHNGESIQNNDRYEIEYIDKSSVLKVGEALRTDRGEYQVKAVNKLGECNASFLVTVTDKPSPPGKARVLMTLGRSVTLSWHTPCDDGGCKIGNYIVEYYKLGWNVWLKAATSRQLTTILGDLIEGSEYKFRIKAESPYGISDPGEESDVIFIPDPKRGITTPQIRSRSQPRDLIEDVMTPTAVKRTFKGQPRSQSTTRVETDGQNYNISAIIENAGVPKRPERHKIKSPPKTPQPSPIVSRKEITQIDQRLLHRESLSRELAYGSPELKIKKPNLNSSNSSQSSTVSSSPNPISNQSEIRPISPKILPPPDITPARSNIKTIEITNQSSSPSPSPSMSKRSIPRESHNENFNGSSEFMLVLYPDGSEQDHRRASDIRLDFDDNTIPPPLSLSAPELGAEPPIFENLRPAASSTELLHARAMIRLNDAALAEEAELEKRRMLINDSRSLSLDIPRIQINSKDDQEIVGLERINSFKRRYSAGGLTHQQLWAQRRFSLRNTNDLSDVIDSQIQKNNSNNKTKLKMTEQRSLSQEREDEEFDKVRAKMALQGQSSFEKRSIRIIDEEQWMEEDGEESYSESEDETESSNENDERFQEKEVKSSRKFYSDDDDEEEIYRPGVVLTNYKGIGNNEPFEILTKRNKLPDPNFVPKPILKKTEDSNNINQESNELNIVIRQIDKPVRRQRSFSLSQSSNILPKVKNNTLPNANQARQRSFSLIPNENGDDRQRSNSLTDEDLAEILQSVDKSSGPVAPGHSISAVAQISGITAASIVIPENLLNKKKDEEEAKSVIDHYGDIVSTVSQRKRRRSIPQTYLSKDYSNENNNSGSVPDKPQIVANNVAALAPRKNSVTIQDNFQTRSPIEQQNSVDVRKPPSTVDLRKNSLTIQQPPHAQNQAVTKNRSPSPRRIITRDMSSSPPPPQQPTKRRDRSVSPAPPRSRSRGTPSKSPIKSNRTSSKSPARPENWRELRKASQSPRKRSGSVRRNKSPSPVPYSRPRPMLREITTQTSIGLEFRDSSTSTPSAQSDRQLLLMAHAEVQVRSFLDYLTDLAMFVVACWFYLFSNELLAIPILVVMVYRQLKDEVRKRMPRWMLRRMKTKRKL